MRLPRPHPALCTVTYNQWQTCALTKWLSAYERQYFVTDRRLGA